MITIRPLYAAALILALWGFGLSPSAAAQNAGKAATSSDEGKTLFEGSCAVCHGIDGSGGSGPNIRHAASSLGPNGIETLVKVGFIGSGMPTFGELGDEKIRQIVDYVVSFEQEGSAATPGDPQKGKAIYRSKNCSQCHIVDGQGGDLGPDLTRVGMLLSPGLLRDAIVSPGSKLPLDTVLAERAPFKAYLMQRAVTKDGREITGMRVNDDTFSVQLRDASGQIHSLRKSDLQKLGDLPGKSWMPSYKDSLTEAEINDLVAYLASLRGAQ
jgi:cytochrome c oxidase cbb3-type subunit 3